MNERSNNRQPFPTAQRRLNCVARFQDSRITVRLQRHKMSPASRCVWLWVCYLASITVRVEVTHPHRVTASPWTLKVDGVCWGCAPSARLICVDDGLLGAASAPGSARKGLFVFIHLEEKWGAQPPAAYLAAPSCGEMPTPGWSRTTRSRIWAGRRRRATSSTSATGKTSTVNF